MRLYPAGVWDPLGRQTESRMTSHDIICIHTMVGSLAGTDAMFEGDGYGGTESHFGTGGNGEKVRQWQDLAFTADANLYGAGRVISIENADKGPGFPDWGGSNVPDFTDKQTDQLVDLVGWLCSKAAHAGCPKHWRCHQEGIPARLIPDTKQGRRGIGYHRQGIDGSLPDMRIPGGEVWSLARGKICPGDRRVRTLINTIIPRVAGTAPSPEEDDVDLNEDIYRSKGKERSIRELFQRMDRYIDSSYTREKQLLDLTRTGHARVLDAVKDLDPVKKAEVQKLLESLDAEIRLVVVEDSPSPDDPTLDGV